MTFGPHPKPPKREKAKRKPLKSRSAKRAKLYAEERVPLVERLLRERPRCELGAVIGAHLADARLVVHTDFQVLLGGRRSYTRTQYTTWTQCTVKSTDLHEKLTRGRGGSITDEANILCCCRRCHDWVGAHPKESLALGLVLSAFPGRNKA